LPETTQEIEPEHAQNNPGNVGKQIPQAQTEEPSSENDNVCKAQGIEEIPQLLSKAKQVPLPLEVPEVYKDTARMLGLFKPTVSKAVEPKERHKKGIQVPTKGTNNALTQPKSQPKPAPGLVYLEDLEDEDPMTESEHMIVENHGVKQGQEEQNDMLKLNQSSNRLVQKGVKHGLSDPHAQENEHLEQVEVQGLGHMVVEDHGPKKGMAPRLKPQFNPLFFPFAMCLPDSSMPQDYDLKEGRNRTPKVHSQTPLNGRESNNEPAKSELHDHQHSTLDTTSPNLIQSELTSPWPDQWRLEGLSNDMPDLEDPCPNQGGINAWNDASDTEEPDLTDNALFMTLWGLFGEPRWITNLDNVIEPEPEEDPFPLMLHYPEKGYKSKLEGELSPQTTNDTPDLKEILSLQNDQRDQEI